jgi:hypothetical protein
MPAPERVIYEYEDVGGGFLRTSGWIGAGLSSGPLTSALQAGSNSNLLFVTQALPAIGTTTPLGAQYRLCQDVALFNFQTVAGTSIQIALPAPLLALFGANSTVVDATNALSASIIAAAIGTLADNAGNLATAFAGGSKSSRRTEQV